VRFTDSEIQQVYERNYGCLGGLPEDQRQIAGLMAVYDWARLIRDEESSPVAEALAFLLSAEMRPALRRWYIRSGSNMNEAALEFRERLARLTGESFG
jgi:hypothetical protein